MKDGISSLIAENLHNLHIKPRTCCAIICWALSHSEINIAGCADVSATHAPLLGSSALLCLGRYNEDSSESMCFRTLLTTLQTFSGFLALFIKMGFPNSIPRASGILPIPGYVFYSGNSTGKCHLLPKTVCGRNDFGRLIEVPWSCLRDPFENFSIIMMLHRHC